MPASPTKKNKTVPPAVRAEAKTAPPTAQRVADLAWTGQHAPAIELASTALTRADLTVADRLDLLDLRAESLIAQGKLDAAGADAKAMLELARRARKAAYLAQALNRRAIVEFRTGNARAATVTADEALLAARKSKQAVLEATSLFRLAEAQF